MNHKTMAVSKDGAMAARIPNQQDLFDRAKSSGARWSPIPMLWHWTGRQPYNDHDIPGLLLSVRGSEWTAEHSADEIAKALSITERITMDADCADMAGWILAMDEEKQHLMVTAAAVALMMDEQVGTITAVFPDNTQLRVDQYHRPLRLQQAGEVIPTKP